MLLLLQSLLIMCSILTIVKGNCGPCGPMPKHYEELECIGKHIDGPCCPERYIIDISMKRNIYWTSRLDMNVLN